ncbi:MAG: hypothetical protein GY913_05945 [Proteobacteria bacterium]|nr:hypothetical protein [Pseudomonadota bacterium]MCP4916447.1 hypothetical protein [Pseudomonadota bacterium]
MTTTLDQAFAELGESRLTPLVLNALDFIVPGEWEDITDLDDLVEDVAGERDPMVAKKAREIFIDPNRPYQRALQVYQLVDRADQVAAGVVLANKAVGAFEFLSFLKKFTPQPDTVQAVDLAVKLVAEIVAFGLLEGRPELSREGLADLAADLGDYAKQDRVRIAAWVVIDGVLPLGPDFIQAVQAKLAEVGTGGLGESAIYKKLSSMIPGDSDEEKHGFLVQALGSAQAWAEGQVTEHGLTTELVQEKLVAFVEGADAGADYLAAALDASTSYFRHTGTLTVARACIEDALDEVDEPEEELVGLPDDAPPWHRSHRPAKRQRGDEDRMDDERDEVDRLERERAARMRAEQDRQELRRMRAEHEERRREERQERKRRRREDRKGGSGPRGPRGRHRRRGGRRR